MNGVYVVRDWSSAFFTFPYCLVRCVCHCHHFGRLVVVAPFAAASLSLSLSGTCDPGILLILELPTDLDSYPECMHGPP